jgi:hypothetical protein
LVDHVVESQASYMPVMALKRAKPLYHILYGKTYVWFKNYKRGNCSVLLLLSYGDFLRMQRTLGAWGSESDLPSWLWCVRLVSGFLQLYLNNWFACRIWNWNNGCVHGSICNDASSHSIWVNVEHSLHFRIPGGYCMLIRCTVMGGQCVICVTLRFQVMPHFLHNLMGLVWSCSIVQLSFSCFPSLPSLFAQLLVYIHVGHPHRHVVGNLLTYSWFSLLLLIMIYFFLIIFSIGGYFLLIF